MGSMGSTAGCGARDLPGMWGVLRTRAAVGRLGSVGSAGFLVERLHLWWGCGFSGGVIKVIGLPDVRENHRYGMVFRYIFDVGYPIRTACCNDLPNQARAASPCSVSFCVSE